MSERIPERAHHEELEAGLNRHFSEFLHARRDYREVIESNRQRRQKQEVASAYPTTIPEDYVSSLDALIDLCSQSRIHPRSAMTIVAMWGARHGIDLETSLGKTLAHTTH
ncbi:hypothetical protein HY405_01335 [Candidatus Microgenomates bacterium]|nr:hypothetical protein [Candidatus Microgenomates bacterium]